jgi:DeoR/GlpR family transcriptional regulator of sugar metabolism
MLKEERQNIILDLMRQNGKVVAAELSARLEVSEDTIRRDLRDLASQGQLKRVHGGGLPHSPAGISYAERLKQTPAVKASLARAAIPFIQNGQTVFLDSGTTTQQIAGLLPANLKATFVTNSPVTAIELTRNEGIDIILIGGRVNKEMQIVTGVPSVDALRSIHADLCFLGICSLDPIGGISVIDYEEAMVKRAMIDHSDRVIALAAKEKLGTISPFKVASITELDCLITENDPANEMTSVYSEMGIEIIRV